jgi:type IV secretory pathway component VirB8
MSAETPINKETATPVDKIGAFPMQYDTDALPERRTAALARMMCIVATVEAFAIAGMGFALAALVPLQKVVPMVITSNDKGDEIIRVNPTTLESPTSDYVTEIALRDYVTKRYAIVGNTAEQTANWGPGSAVQLMSTPEAYQDFATKSKTEWEKLRNARMTRSVRIDSVRKIGERTWQVEFNTTDKADETPFQQAAAGTSQAWVSTFELAFEPKNVKYSDRLNNPFGMTIVSANDARRD